MHFSYGLNMQAGVSRRAFVKAATGSRHRPLGTELATCMGHGFFEPPRSGLCRDRYKAGGWCCKWKGNLSF